MLGRIDSTLVSKTWYVSGVGAVKSTSSRYRSVVAFNSKGRYRPHRKQIMVALERGRCPAALDGDHVFTPCQDCLQ